MGNRTLHKQEDEALGSLFLELEALETIGILA